MKLRSLLIAATAATCFVGYAVAQDEDPNLDSGNHPPHETEATATKDFHVGDDGSKNHPVGEHRPAPEPKEPPPQSE